MGRAKTCQEEAYPQVTQIHTSNLCNLCNLWMKTTYEFISKTSGTKAEIRLSKGKPVRERASNVNCSDSQPRGLSMSYGEPIALRGQMELEQVAPAAVAEVRPQVEDQFIERLKRGDAAAFEKLVNERSGEIFGLLYRLTENGEEARDLTQETFLRAFQSIGHFRGEADLRTWIYRIAINQARNRWRWWRRRRREATVSIDAPEIGGGRLGLVATLKSPTA